MSTRFTRGGVAGVVSTVAAVGTILAPGTATADTLPTVPTNLRVQQLSFTSATLAWDVATDDSGWVMYEAQVEAKPHVLQRFGAIEPTKTFTNLMSGLTYTATVVTVDGAHQKSAPATIQFTTPVDNTTPTTPTNLRPVIAGGKLDSLRWDAADDNSLVHYMLRTSGTRIYVTDDTSVPAAELLKLDPIVLPGSTHTMTVEAFDDHGHVSARSNPLTVTFPA